MWAVPHWLESASEADMQIHSHVLKCAVYLCLKTERDYIPIGTGFIVNYTDDDLDFGYIITCSHVVKPRLKDGSRNESDIWLSINTKEGPPRYIKTTRGDWTPHIDGVDACVIGCDDSWDNDNQLDTGPLSQGVIGTPEKETRAGMALGDGVFLAGLFVGRPGERKNIPVVRVANIASMPIEPAWPSSPKRPIFLIETKSLGGTSGSPIFLNADQFHRVARPRVAPIDPKTGGVILPYLLIGMMQGAHGGHFADEFVIEDDGPKIPKDADFNAGIGIGIPIQQICEIFEYDSMKAERKASIALRRQRSGYRPTSAGAAAKDEGNPSHREDFTSLLNAAAKKKSQDDQT